MQTKLSKISAFIESLPQESNLGDCQSVLLSTNMKFMGGNGNNCINEMYEKCYESTNNGNCQNYSGYCWKSTNRGSCINSGDTRPTNPVKPGIGIVAPGT